MRFGPLVAVCAVVAGILGGENLDAASARPLLIVGAAALVCAWFTQARVRLVLFAVALALVGANAMVRALDGRLHSSLTPGIERRTAVTLDGELTSDPSGPQFGVNALVRVRAGSGIRTLLAVANGDDAMALRALDAGDHVTLTGRLGPLGPAHFDDQARWQHAVGRLNESRVVALRHPGRVMTIANAARARVLAGTRALAPTPRALTAGFLLGDTRDIPTDLVGSYRDAGLSHLLAVSGENVAFVLALIAPPLRRMRLGGRTAVALGVVFVFAAMTRFEPSVLRASVMAAITLLAVLAGRPASSLRVLAYAATVLLLVDPFLLHSVGFVLSCGASAGIAALSSPFARRLPGPRVVREPLAVSLAAQVGVMPVLLWAFGSFPLVTPLANLAAAPAAEALGVYGFCASLAAGGFPPCGPLVQQPTALLVTWITTVARAGAAFPVTIDGRGALGLLSVGAAGASLACRSARRPVPEPASR